MFMASRVPSRRNLTASSRHATTGPEGGRRPGGARDRLRLYGTNKWGIDFGRLWAGALL